MKYQITIEGTVAKDFWVETDSSEEACRIVEEKYKAGEFVLDPGKCQFRRMSVFWVKQSLCGVAGFLRKK